MGESAISGNRRSGPIFIVGAIGSGTTRLRRILDRHPNIAVPQETGFARALLAQQHTPFWVFGDQWWGRLGYTDEAFKDHLRDFYGTMFRRYAEQHGKQRWGETTPYHVWHVDRLAEIFPDAVFVAIVRHPGGNIASLQRRFKYGLKRSVDHWLDTNRELLALTEERGERMVLCRYEDVVLRTEPTLRELLEWVGEPWSPLELEHDSSDTARVSQWLEQLDAKGHQVLRNRTVGIGSIFGYDVHEPVPAALMGGDGQTLLMTGVEAAARVAEIRPAILELRVRPEPRLADRPLDPRKVGLPTDRERTAGRDSKRKPKGRSADTAGKNQRAQRPPTEPTPPTNAKRSRVAFRLPKPVRRRLGRMRAARRP